MECKIDDDESYNSEAGDWDNLSKADVGQPW
jgi:hypothetical protein